MIRIRCNNNVGIMFMRILILLHLVVGELAAQSAWKDEEDTYGCRGKPADVIFAIDTSNSIWPADFFRQLDFVNNLTSLFTIGPNNIMVGVLTYAEHPRLQFHLDYYKTKSDLQDAIDNIQQDGGYVTRTADALRYLREMSTTSSAGKKRNVTKIGIVITDGLSHNTTETAIEAGRTRDAGIHLFAVGVGKNRDVNELESIASRPLDYYLFQVESFRHLESIKHLLAIKTCQVTDPTTTMTPPTTTRLTTIRTRTTKTSTRKPTTLRTESTFRPSRTTADDRNQSPNQGNGDNFARSSSPNKTPLPGSLIGPNMLTRGTASFITGSPRAATKRGGAKDTSNGSAGDNGKDGGKGQSENGETGKGQDHRNGENRNGKDRNNQHRNGHVENGDGRNGQSQNGQDGNGQTGKDQSKNGQYHNGEDRNSGDRNGQGGSVHGGNGQSENSQTGNGRDGNRQPGRGQPGSGEGGKDLSGNGYAGNGHAGKGQGGNDQSENSQGRNEKNGNGKGGKDHVSTDHDGSNSHKNGKKQLPSSHDRTETTWSSSFDKNSENQNKHGKSTKNGVNGNESNERTVTTRPLSADPDHVKNSKDIANEKNDGSVTSNPSGSDKNNVNQGQNENGINRKTNPSKINPSASSNKQSKSGSSDSTDEDSGDTKHRDNKHTKNGEGKNNGKPSTNDTLLTDRHGSKYYTDKSSRKITVAPLGSHDGGKLSKNGAPDDNGAGDLVGPDRASSKHGVQRVTRNPAQPSVPLQNSRDIYGEDKGQGSRIDAISPYKVTYEVAPDTDENTHGHGGKIWRLSAIDGDLMYLGKPIDSDENEDMLKSKENITEVFTDGEIIYGLDHDNNMVKIGCVFNGTHYIGHWVEDEDGNQLWYGYPKNVATNGSNRSHESTKGTQTDSFKTGDRMPDEPNRHLISDVKGTRPTASFDSIDEEDDDQFRGVTTTDQAFHRRERTTSSDRNNVNNRHDDKRGGTTARSRNGNVKAATTPSDQINSIDNDKNEDDTKGKQTIKDPDRRDHSVSTIGSNEKDDDRRGYTTMKNKIDDVKGKSTQRDTFDSFDEDQDQSGEWDTDDEEDSKNGKASTASSKFNDKSGDDHRFTTSKHAFDKRNTMMTKDRISNGRVNTTPRDEFDSVDEDEDKNFKDKYDVKHDKTTIRDGIESERDRITTKDKFASKNNKYNLRGTTSKAGISNERDTTSRDSYDSRSKDNKDGDTNGGNEIDNDRDISTPVNTFDSRDKNDNRHGVSTIKNGIGNGKDKSIKKGAVDSQERDDKRSGTTARQRASNGRDSTTQRDGYDSRIKDDKYGATTKKGQFGFGKVITTPVDTDSFRNKDHDDNRWTTNHRDINNRDSSDTLDHHSKSDEQNRGRTTRNEFYQGRDKTTVKDLFDSHDTDDTNEDNRFDHELKRSTVKDSLDSLDTDDDSIDIVDKDRIRDTDNAYPTQKHGDNRGRWTTRDLNNIGRDRTTQRRPLHPEDENHEDDTILTTFDRNQNRQARTTPSGISGDDSSGLDPNIVANGYYSIDEHGRPVWMRNKGSNIYQMSYPESVGETEILVQSNNREGYWGPDEDGRQVWYCYLAPGLYERMNRPGPPKHRGPLDEPIPGIHDDDLEVIVDSEGNRGVWKPDKKGRQVWYRFVCPGVYEGYNQTPTGYNPSIHEVRGNNITYMFPGIDDDKEKDRHLECLAPDENGVPTVYRYVGPGKKKKVPTATLR